MRKLAILTFVSLDGVMQGVGSPDEDPAGGFRQGGWAMPYWDGVMAQVEREAMAEPYDMLFGRKTYELFAASRDAGPNSENVNSKLDAARKYVLSSTMARSDWQNTIILSGDLTEEIPRLKAKDGPLIQIHGSSQLIQALLTADLVDEMRLWIFPVTLGSGKKPFADSPASHRFDLVKSEPTGNGVVMNIYRKTDAAKS
ncbi:MAG: dihydrofolate reductase family protein [Pseudomonadota bacterium]